MFLVACCYKWRGWTWIEICPTFSSVKCDVSKKSPQMLRLVFPDEDVIVLYLFNTLQEQFFLTL